MKCSYCKHRDVIRQQLFLIVNVWFYHGMYSVVMCDYLWVCCCIYIKHINIGLYRVTSITSFVVYLEFVRSLNETDCICTLVVWFFLLYRGFGPQEVNKWRHVNLRGLITDILYMRLILILWCTTFRQKYSQNWILKSMAICFPKYHQIV